MLCDTILCRLQQLYHILVLLIEFKMCQSFFFSSSLTHFFQRTLYYARRRMLPITNSFVLRHSSLAVYRYISSLRNTSIRSSFATYSSSSKCFKSSSNSITNEDDISIASSVQHQRVWKAEISDDVGEKGRNSIFHAFDYWTEPIHQPQKDSIMSPRFLRALERIREQVRFCNVNMFEKNVKE